MPGVPAERCKVRFYFRMDKFAQKTYAANFGELPKGDITQIPASNPEECYSQASVRHSAGRLKEGIFRHPRDSFDIQRILVAKRPRMFVLENVKQLRGTTRTNPRNHYGCPDRPQ